MLLTLHSSHRDINIIEDSHHLLSAYLSSHLDSSITLRSFDWSWSGWPFKNQHLEIATLQPLTLPTKMERTPKQAMWDQILADYTPSTHPAHIACTPPVDSTLPPATLAAAQVDN